MATKVGRQSAPESFPVTIEAHIGDVQITGGTDPFVVAMAKVVDGHGSVGKYTMKADHLVYVIDIQPQEV